MAPLAHAVGFVDGKEAELAALVQRIELGQEAGGGDAFGGGVEQGDVAAQHALFYRAGFLKGEGGIEERRLNACLMQCAHLVLHQRDQRRDHHRHAMACMLARNSGYLVAERFAATRGHQHQGVTACTDMLDDGLLRAAKAVVTEDLAEDGKGRQGVNLGQYGEMRNCY